MGRFLSAQPEWRVGVVCGSLCLHAPALGRLCRHSLQDFQYHTYSLLELLLLIRNILVPWQTYVLNWEKGKPSGSIACIGNSSLGFLSCSTVVLIDATSLTPLSTFQIIFKWKQNTIHDPWGPDKYNYTMMKCGATGTKQYFKGYNLQGCAQLPRGFLISNYRYYLSYSSNVDFRW